MRRTWAYEEFNSWLFQHPTKPYLKVRLIYLYLYVSQNFQPMDIWLKYNQMSQNIKRKYFTFEDCFLLTRSWTSRDTDTLTISAIWHWADSRLWLSSATNPPGKTPRQIKWKENIVCIRPKAFLANNYSRKNVRALSFNNSSLLVFPF